MSKKKKNNPLKVGHITCDETHTHPCKHCGAPALFVEEVLGKNFYSCRECGGFTKI